MPEHQTSLLFSKYTFNQEELMQLEDMLKTPLLRAYIQHLVSTQVEEHILTPILHLKDEYHLRDNEMFTKGVVQLGEDILSLSLLAAWKEEI